MRYELDAPARTEMPDAFGERFCVELEAGIFTPRSEREELAAQHLVALGFARVAKSKTTKER